MPPTEDMIDKAIDSLMTVQLKSFTASPGSVLPLNNVTLRWEATKPSGPGARHVVFKLQGIKVENSGSRTIQPVKPVSFSLSAEAFTVKRPLGSVSIDVDLSGCSVSSIPQRALLTNFRNDLRQQFPQDVGRKVELNNLPDITLRVNDDRTQLKLDTGGMKVAGELDVEVNGLPDGTLTFSALIGLGAENGRPVHRIISFNSDFDYDTKVDILSLGLAKLVDIAIDRYADDNVRDVVDRNVGQMLSSLAALIPSTCALLTVAAARNRVDFTLCPTQVGVECRPPQMRVVKDVTVAREVSP